MKTLSQPPPIDYLVMGHITKDIHSRGYVLGGTVAYSGLTAKALGLHVGIVTSAEPGLPLGDLEQVDHLILPSERTTIFRNEQSGAGRKQWLLDLAEKIEPSHIPETWKRAPIIHLAPVIGEISPKIVDYFKNRFICITAQGWLRKFDNKGKVSFSDWMDKNHILGATKAVVIGIEDVEHDEKRIEEFAQHAAIFVVTEGANGARVYWNNDLRRFRAPKRKEVDATGAGDIFASAFFIRLHQTNDPWEAARFATILASNSVTRRGLASIPTIEEIRAARVEVLESI